MTKLNEYCVSKTILLTVSTKVKAPNSLEAIDKENIPWDLARAIKEGYLEQGSQCTLTTKVWDKEYENCLLELDG